MGVPLLLCPLPGRQNTITAIRTEGVSSSIIRSSDSSSNSEHGVCASKTYGPTQDVHTSVTTSSEVADAEYTSSLEEPVSLSQNIDIVRYTLALLHYSKYDYLIFTSTARSWASVTLVPVQHFLPKQKLALLPLPNPQLAAASRSFRR